jgi:stearoyl-CoA desaturase (delta-9 desaturase)
MKIILMIFTCIANQKSIYHWARDHRVHHKGSDTNADPHNIENGFFFAHIGWFFYKKHPDVIAMGKTIDFTDLEKDKIVQFQKKYYLPLSLAFCYYLPAIIGHIFFQNMINGLIVGGFTRHVLTLHSTWCVNSFAHSFGYKPYNPKIKPAENIFVSFVSLGEGQHNLHHTKPYNYKASETPIFNFTTYFIDFMYYIGQAYKLKM